MSPRDYRYLDVDRIEERVKTVPVEEDDGVSHVDLLYELVLDLLQLAGDEGLPEEEIDEVIDRVVDYRAALVRASFQLHGGS